MQEPRARGNKKITMIRCLPTGRVTKLAASSQMNLRVAQPMLVPLVLARAEKYQWFQARGLVTEPVVSAMVEGEPGAAIITVALTLSGNVIITCKRPLLFAYLRPNKILL